ncbi:hypothetical protein F4781DRAFT_352793 [Annulohypoxylon bovei var. microspora]|nr:hypothetical protein F4781DRAFT_352793 [Annulohypoxylon bovei var. microspora]
MSCAPQQLDRIESTERAAASRGVLDLGVVFSGGCQGLAAIYPLFLASHADPNMPLLANDNPCLLWIWLRTVTTVGFFANQVKLLALVPNGFCR